MAKSIKNRTQRQDGFWMPAEFEQQEKIWMIWPERSDNWRLGGKPAQKAFKDVAEVISKYAHVTMCVSEGQYDNAREVLNESIRVIEMSSDDAWMRDCGPAFVKNELGEIRGVHFGFNAWGGLVDGLYFPWNKDQKIPTKICEVEGVLEYDATNFVLEGGSFNVDGQGTLITTEQCLLSEGRNPHLNKAEITEYLSAYLGVEKVIWLPLGIDPEETNGHVDDVCAFARPGEVVIAWTDDENHPYYHVYKQAYNVLKNETDAKGRKFKIHKVPLAYPGYLTKEEAEGVDEGDAISRREGDEYAPSYMNYLTVNGGIICPQFGIEQDKDAIRALEKIYPDYDVVGVMTKEIIFGGGNIHCITQQQPKSK